MQRASTEARLLQKSTAHFRNELFRSMTRQFVRSRSGLRQQAQLSCCPQDLRCHIAMDDLRILQPRHRCVEPRRAYAFHIRRTSCSAMSVLYHGQSLGGDVKS
eukprot:7620178-Pyramimonas_sp.AAC.1